MGSLVRRFALIVAIVAALGCLGPLPPLHTRAAANTYLVNLPGDAGVGSGLSGDIRYAITQANANPGSSITFDRAATGPTILLTQTLTLSASMTITGPGANLLAVDGGCTTCDAPVLPPSTGATVFVVNLGATVTLSGLTVQHGLTQLSSSAGGIVNHGTLALTGDTLVGNVTVGGFRSGGALYNDGALTVAASTISGNSAVFSSPEEGAALLSNGGTVALTDTTIAGNTGQAAPFVLSAILIDGGTATATNTTITGNHTGDGGAAGTLNTGALTLTNTIVAGNTASACPDIRNTLISGGHNLIGDTTCGTGISDGDPQGDIVNPTPLLGALGAHGGPTQTVPLLTGSPALAHGDPAVCALPLPPATAPNGAGGVDQRGLPRPATVCAIGAYEPQPNTIIATAGSGQQVTVGTAFPTNLAAKVADDQANPLPGWSVTFAAPAPTGPSGTFAGSAIVTTDASGAAIAPTFTANTHAGGYSVAANLTGTALVPPATFALTNLPGPAAALAVSGYPASVLSGTSHPFAVTAVDAFGNTATGYTGAVRFTSTDPHAALPADYPFVARDAGVHSFSATFATAGTQALTATDTATGSITGTQAGIAVFAIATTTTLAVAPSPAAHGATVTLTATVAAVAPTSAGIGPAAPVAPVGTVTFADGGTTLATVALVGGQAAFATSTLSVGVHHLSATYNPSVPGPYATSTGTADETITAAPLVGIAVTPANATLKVGQGQQYTATGTYADSSTADLTGAVAWTSDAPGVVGVDATGNGTAKGAGSAHVVATQGGVSGQASVTVGTPVLTGVQPAPAPQSRPSGTTRQPVGGTPPSPPPAPTGR
jgi:hypothetical protein